MEMGSERVISKMTGITACLYIDGNDPVERKNLKVQDRGDNCWSKCFGVGLRDGIVPRGRHCSQAGARPGHHNDSREDRD